MEELEKKIQSLPPDLRSEVEDFVEFLLEKKAAKGRKQPSLEWAGSLKELAKEYTSVELQHSISKLRMSEK